MRDVSPPIIITGVPRSRTSMVASIFHACGAWIGDTVEGNESNPYGYFENEDIRQTIVKPHLHSIGADRLGQRPLPTSQVVDPHLREQVERSIRQQGYTGGPWLYKDAKALLQWATWAVAYPDAQWIFVDRDRWELLDSILRTPFMKAYDTRASWDIYVDQCHIFRKQAAMNVRMLDVDSGDLGSIREAVEWCGLEWSEDAAELVKG